eukprot:7010886-Ditylum_brightwellii.AAC.1
MGCLKLTLGHYVRGYTKADPPPKHQKPSHIQSTAMPCAMPTHPSVVHIPSSSSALSSLPGNHVNTPPWVNPKTIAHI